MLKGVPIIMTGCLKSCENGNPGMPIFTGCVYFHDNGCVNQKRATRNKAKKFSIKDGILHYTELLSEEGKAAIPTDPDSPASRELLPSYRDDRQVLGLVPHGVCRT